MELSGQSGQRCSAVRYHHQPMSAGAFQLEASMVHVADHIVNALQLGTSGERWIPPLQNKAWERLNLPVDIIESTVETVDGQIAEVERAFLGAAATAVS
jgi:hypothetical protein